MAPSTRDIVTRSSELRTQFFDLVIEDAVVLGIIDRAIDKVDAGARQTLFEQA